MNPFTFIQESIAMLHMPEIGFSEILDIIILCGIIYYVMRWIRQTHAWALLKGIVMVVLVALIAYLFDLVTVIWVVQNALAMGLIALVILFQPELRKALEQLGRGVGANLPSLSEHKRKGISQKTIDEIAGAAAVMSSQKIGALICLERDVILNDIEDTGIPVDAIVTRQLIMNIFTNRTPLHDGATIIRNNRIAASACILPLTAEDVGHDLGTRHRAALGVSEVSDVLVIVVSEETGTISAASGGKLVRNLSDKDLRKALSAEIIEGPKRGFAFTRRKKR